MSQTQQTDPNLELLQQILARISVSELEDLCLAFPPETQLGKAFRLHLKGLRSDYTDIASLENSGDLHALVCQILKDNDVYRRCFWTELLAYLDQKHLTEVQLYTAIGMSQQLYSSRTKKWAADSGTYHRGSYTTRDNVLSICLVLRLNLLEVKNLMAYANYSFSPSRDPRDFIISSCIRKGEFDISRVNQRIHQVDPTLSLLPCARLKEQKDLEADGIPAGKTGKKTAKRGNAYGSAAE